MSPELKVIHDQKEHLVYQYDPKPDYPDFDAIETLSPESSPLPESLSEIERLIHLIHQASSTLEKPTHEIIEKLNIGEVIRW